MFVEMDRRTGWVGGNQLMVGEGGRFRTRGNEEDIGRHDA